jgi:hypothetical protein
MVLDKELAPQPMDGIIARPERSSRDGLASLI